MTVYHNSSLVTPNMERTSLWDPSHLGHEKLQL